WTTFSLTLSFPAGKKKTLGQLLDACSRLRKRFPQHQADLRREVLEHFAIHHDRPSPFDKDLYELDAAGKPTEPSILKTAGGGGIHLEGEGGDIVGITVFFHVPWDDEHGLELFIEDEPEEEAAETGPAAAKVTFHESGPAVTAADIAAFEKEYQINLPP